MAPRSELALLGALILSSCRPAEPGGFRPRIDACATGTHTSWENTGRPITLAWCVPCHSGALVPDERQGAPEEVNFDDYEAVVLWADRIRVRATEAMDMPPMGGVPQEDLDALAEWIDCSLPGGTAATSGFCDAPDSTPGNQVASALACDAAVDIGGDLVVDVATDLDCVCSVGGDLTVTAPSASLPNLQRISGALHVDAAGVAVVTLPALTDAGALQLTGATSLSVLDVSELQRVEGEVSLADLPALPEIRIPELQEVVASVRIERVEASMIALDRLATVGGDVVIQDAPQLVEVRGTRSLSSLGGDLRLEDLPALQNVDDFAELPHVPGSIVIREIGATSIHGFHRLLQVEGDVLVEHCDRLVAARGFPDLERIDGALQWRFNGALVEWDGLNYLVDVGGDLAVEENPVLEALPSIQRLEHVGGDFTVRDNLVLPTASAENLAAQIVIDGDVIISGNQ